MRALMAFVVVVLLGFMGCAVQSGPPVPLKTVVFSDVQGLYGGQALWLAEDQTAFVQIVARPSAGKSGLWEKRYKFKITFEQWAEVERLVGAHHFFTLKIPERPGVPDEAHPIIAVTTKAGESARVWKWANDKHADFDSLYRHLLLLCHEKGERLREGPFEIDWRPDGFAKP